MPALLGYIRTSTTVMLFHHWDGPLQPLQDVGDYWTPLGGSGSSAQILRQVAPPSEVVAYSFFTALANARVYQSAIAALVADVVSVIDPFGTTWNHVLLKELKKNKVVRRRGAWAGAQFNYFLDLEMTLEVQP